ncbi:hypothetical protein NKDENANG_03234 [Candidatus Entotheonellaceae bacterium PAL068K]
MPRAPAFDLRQHYDRHLARRWRRGSFVLRITAWKDLPVPVLVVKERQSPKGATRDPAPTFPDSPGQSPQGNLVERGHLAGAAQRRCLPILRRIAGRVRDDDGVPLELQRYFTLEGLRLRLNLPLDEEAGARFGLIFRLQGGMADLDRVELMARRVARFTREEAVYWLSRMTRFDPDANRWAISGLRIMLGGQAKDPAVQRMLERLRASA